MTRGRSDGPAARGLRVEPRRARTIVVKVGSGTLTDGCQALVGFTPWNGAS